MKKAISFLLVSLFMFSVLSLVASARPKYAYDESKKRQCAGCKSGCGAVEKKDQMEQQAISELK